ncbi:CAAX protease self-immunity [Anaerosphaera aminiphila DSM 21120]|uniref:CAAX protease self-immunity n=1 Tax=Anaerosphaera aminiphila DSM 21120 TaxID=1120995 RepID=A0A1M5U6N0_9FIRM|nr:type II CAAX endopeptidase family protein [Anaerosphaera aminiphila]SHH58702.1 CAAX protease self-immunity [Anaerosphaera aminiphila DSM 21120]
MEKENKQLKLFFITNFGLVALFGMFFWLNRELDSSYLAGMMMLFPALSVGVAKYFTEEKSELPLKFYGVYLIAFIVMVILLVLYKLNYMSVNKVNSLVNIIMMFGSFMILLVDLDKREKNGLQFGLNFKVGLKYILVFVLVYLFRGLLGSYEFLNIKLLLSYIIKIPLLVMLFFFSCMYYMGEEYGWRYFLQEKLQNKLGKRLGVIVLGAIWGLWHLPLNFMLYSPQTPIYSVISYIVSCICYSVFFGLVQMKTKNVWIATIIHYLNNNMAVLFVSEFSYESVYTIESFLVSIAVEIILFMPFILSKEYRVDSKK